ncbi:MAG: helix-turn-helix transcriptional regulator [Lachnospiraceae bacterium]|nr:helix-turn-helix transcriptional regulator [Lachnospiraceae bacterium]
MNGWKLSENIIRLRREKKITQEELADFVGVTKASVSKWENSQSMPDILMLPRLAAFFNVSVDALIGYEPQLGREQIQKIYQELAADFAGKPFEETMEKCRSLVKQYYSCYPFLFQMGVLWLNHFMLAKDQEQQREILEEASGLCSHILAECKDIGLCSDAVILRAQMDLLLGRVQEVVETLEETVNPYRLSGQSDGILIQAYQLAGQKEKADDFTQISMFLHLMNLAADAVWYLELHKDELEICEETIRRMDEMFRIYGMERLNANTAAQFQLQAAVVYSLHGRKAEALERLRQYADTIRWMLDGDHLTQHGDHYFHRISDWYEGCDLGGRAPRDKKLVSGSALQAFAHPAFAAFAEEPGFQRIRRSLEEQVASGE